MHHNFIFDEFLADFIVDSFAKTWKIALLSLPQLIHSVRKVHSVNAIDFIAFWTKNEVLLFFQTQCFSFILEPCEPTFIGSCNKRQCNMKKTGCQRLLRLRALFIKMTGQQYLIEQENSSKESSQE